MPTNVTFPGNLGQTETIADLRDLPSTFIDPGTIYVVKGVGRAYSYDPGSLAADDGLNVIRPNDRTPLQAGRFLYEVDGIASGPQGPTGPANSTYTTLAGLKAAQITNVSALYDGSAWFWTLGNYSGLANDRTIVASDLAPISTGAWIRSTPVVLLKDFGARLDGVTDDSPAVRLALASFAGNIKLDFGTGLMVLASQVLVQGKSNLTFVGQGARIKGGTTRFRSYFKFLNCSRVRIEGLTFDQMQQSLPVYTLTDYNAGIMNCPIEIDNCNRFVVTACCFDNLYTSAVYPYQSSDVAITDCVFTSPVQTQMYWIDHIRAQTCAGLVVARCRFINAAITNPATGCCSIFASGISGYALIEGNYSEYAGRDNTGTHRLGVIDFYGDAQTVRIINNTSRNGMAQFARLSSLRSALFEGNRIHASPNAELDYSMVAVESTPFFSPGQVGALDIMLRDNLCEDPAHRHAFAFGIISYDNGVPSINVGVVDNAFDGCRRSVLIRGPNYGCTVAGNSMRGAAGMIQVDHQTAITSEYGTEAGSVFRALTICGNDLLDESGGSASAVTISLAKSPPYTGQIDQIRIENNNIRATSLNGGQGVVVNLAADTPKGHAIVAGNEIVNYTIGIYQRAALIATIRDNRMLSCPTPILDDGSATTVERHGNRYSGGALSGRAVLSAGTATVLTPEVRTGDLGRILVWPEVMGGTPGFLSAGGINDATSFTLNSTSNTDTSTVRWQIDR